MDPRDFAALVRHTGLKPKDHDLDELQAAHVRLRELLARLHRGAPEDETLAVFDPRKPL